MAKHLIQLEVDGSQMFDVVAKVGGNEAPHLIGYRLIGLMMTGEINLSDTIGLAVYGIEVRSVQRLKPAAAIEAPGAEDVI
jgi:hypothetical protein